MRYMLTRIHTHTHTQHTVVHKMHTVVHYTLIGTTHGGTQQLQQCTTHTVVHDTRTFGLKGEVICLALMVVVTPENTTNYVTT